MKKNYLRYLIYTDFFRLTGRDLTKKEYLISSLGRHLKVLGYASVGFKFLFDYRHYKYCVSNNRNSLAKKYWRRRYNRTCMRCGIDFSIYTDVGRGFCVYHANGIVVADGVVFGDNCSILHQVTIGHKRAGDMTAVIGNGVTIYSGAKLIGDIKIGDGVVVGCNSVVTHDAPENCSVCGVPAKILKTNINHKRTNTNYLEFENYSC